MAHTTAGRANNRGSLPAENLSALMVVVVDGWIQSRIGELGTRERDPDGPVEYY